MNPDEKQEKRRKGGQKGGRARAERLSAAQRSDIARQAAEARWGPSIPDGASVAKATHMGQLEIGDSIIPCAVLEDGRRVLSQRAVNSALGRQPSSSGWFTREGAEEAPPYLAPKMLKPYIPNDLSVMMKEPMFYTSPKATRPAYGIEAKALPKICDVWIDARAAGVLRTTQLHMAAKADVLMRGLAHVGIIALVDEATGFQEDRDRDELHKILAAYIAEELMPWTKRFPESFYEELFRLHGWSYSRQSGRRPRLAGKRTNELIYDKLPTGVLEELRKKNPVVKKGGYRRHKHHQFLTEDVGNRHLEKQLVAVIALMRAAADWDEFKKLFKRAFPENPDQMDLLTVGNGNE